MCINIFHIINILFLSLRLLTNFLMFFLLSMASKIREWNLVTRCSFALLLWLNGWSSYIWCVILVNDIMDLFMSSLGTLVPEGPCCVFYATRRQVRSDTSCGFLLVLWFNITHTRTHARTHAHIQSKQGSYRLTHPDKYISTPPVLFSHQLSRVILNE